VILTDGTTLRIEQFQPDVTERFKAGVPPLPFTFARIDCRVDEVATLQYFTYFDNISDSSRGDSSTIR
jgi:hypothetical protein